MNISEVITSVSLVVTVLVLFTIFAGTIGGVVASV